MSAPINNGGPAFPVHEGPGDPWDKDHRFASTGMTLRDYFAARAMQMHGESLSDIHVESEEEWDALVSKRAYQTADAMLRARGDK